MNSSKGGLATIGDAVGQRLVRVNRPDRGYVEQPEERVAPQAAEPATERKRRKIITDDAVKMAAAERVLIGGAKRADVAANLDVASTTVGLWIEEYRRRVANGELTPSGGKAIGAQPTLEIRFDGLRIEGLEEYIEALVDARVEARVSAAVKAELRKRLAGD